MKATILATSAKATMIEWSGKEFWIPLSQSTVTDDLIILSDWIAKEKGLPGRMPVAKDEEEYDTALMGKTSKLVEEDWLKGLR